VLIFKLGENVLFRFERIETIVPQSFDTEIRISIKIKNRKVFLFFPNVILREKKLYKFDFLSSHKNCTTKHFV